MTKSLVILREAIARLLVVFLALLITCLIKGEPIRLHYMGLMMIFIPMFIFSLSMTRKKKVFEPWTSLCCCLWVREVGGGTNRTV